MVIVALDHVPHCYSAQDGAVIYGVLKLELARDGHVTLSLKGVSDVPSSFVNAALVPFVRERGLNWVKKHVRVTAATNQVAGMIRRCLANADDPTTAAA